MSSSEKQVRNNHAKFEAMLADLADRVDESPVEDTLEKIRLAALFAWSQSCGFYASPELEALIGRISRRLPFAPSVEREPQNGKRRVMIVMSAAYGVGGHSRLASRWIQLDTQSDFTVVFTLPDNLVVPDQFKSFADSGRIQLISLDQATFSARAVALRALVEQVDFVVLLIHPHDVIPNLALATMANAPPVLFQDHASHTFWLGATVSRLVLSETGTLVARRGIPAQHISWNPLPMDFCRISEQPTQDVRSAFGIPVDAPLLLSCGAAFKYNPIDNVSLASLLSPLFERNLTVHMLVIGVGLPGMPFTPAWRELMGRFGDRIKLVGRIDEMMLNACFRSADVYLDSTPQSSPTTLFEAAAHGLPVVRFARQDWRETEFSLDMETLPTGHYIWSDEDDYRNDIARLLSDTAYYDWRSDLGQRTVELVHSDRSFLNAVEIAYQRAEQIPLISLAQNAGECRADRLSDLLHQLFQNLHEQDRWETDWKVYAVAVALAEKGDVDEAMLRMISLAEKETCYWQVYNDLACYALGKQDADAAIDLLRKAVQVSWCPNVSSLNLAKALLLVGSHDEAKSTLEKYLQHFPDDLNVRNALDSLSEN